MTPQDRVSTNRLNGLNAELRVAENYQRCGFTLLQKRFRTQGGEIDLIFKHDQKLYFIEVKRATTLDVAHGYLTHHQMDRMQKTILAYLEKEGLPLETEMRVDAALVDAQNRVKVIPNILH